MRGFAFVALCFILVAVTSAEPNCEEKYTTEYDDIDLDEILHGRLLNAYVQCLKTGEKCTPEGKKLKEVLSDALENKCCKCNDKQKESAKKVIHFLLKDKPTIFKDLESIYDKTHKYREFYAEEVKAAGLEFPN